MMRILLRETVGTLNLALFTLFLTCAWVYPVASTKANSIINVFFRGIKANITLLGLWLDEVQILKGER